MRRAGSLAFAFHLVANLEAAIHITLVVARETHVMGAEARNFPFARSSEKQRLVVG